ncbi:carboxylesterase/lipase family protein [Thermus scotoductus]|uniref:Carboxylic ester hydrolase n=1 Tax=Thermus scotoductus TaxID=37636 RepID=A0A430RWJ7_THESC|nr:carboxylesterase family protein [Thermus scotoductus]RTH24754.1 carboxylesterase [Thermus scotoductus]RTI38467.1 carboxylesterase [Thermus scotoductus]
MRPTLLFLLGSLALAQGFLASTPLGRAEGRWEDGAIAFYGLPYAEAGRFQAPRPLKVWPPGVGREKVACPQAFGITAAFGSPIPEEREECLVLNIFLPQALPPPEGFPVMVYLHGGGFGSGSAGEPLYGGHHLAAQGVVVVVPNYRLGPLGFLALPALAREDPKAVGNYALLDLLEALRFVQGYIRYFGGDPGNVTLFGESAGGMLVCTLLATPEAQGLFHRAILQSGGCHQVRPLEKDFPSGERWAKDLGCPPEDLACLRRLPLERLFPPGEAKGLPDITAATLSFPHAPFKPHLGVLLPEIPSEALSQGKARGIPLLVGANLEELAFPTLAWLLGPRTWEEFSGRLAAQGIPPKEREALTKVYQKRFPDPRKAWGEVQTDLQLLCPSLKAARLQAPFAPTYAYLFTFRVPGFEGLGAFHGLELAPLFGQLQEMPFFPLFLSAEAREKAEALGKRMRRYWTSFAREGEPKGWPRWPTYEEGYLLRLDEPPGLLPDPYEERCGVLEALGLL